MALKLNKDFTFSGKSINPTEEKNLLLAPFNKEILNFGQILKMLPIGEEKNKIHQNIGNARFTANKYLEARIDYYNKNKCTMPKEGYLNKLKKDYEFLKLSDKFALESALENVDDAYKNYFKGTSGFPKKKSKFKPNGNSYTTKFTNDNIKLLMIDGLPYIQLPKVGKVRFILPKDKTFDDILNGGRILKATIRKEGNRYFVSLGIEVIIDKILFLKEIEKYKIYAGDLGIKNLLTYGNEESNIIIENKKYIKLHEKRIRRLNKSLARKVKGSNNFNKTKIKLNKEYKKLSNQKKDYNHKISKEISIISDCFICEHLDIKGMLSKDKVKNLSVKEQSRLKALRKEISDANWYQLITFIEYKMKKKGKLFIKADTYFPSSQLCSKCGYQNKAIKDLSIRSWICPECGKVHDRDINAKENLLKFGYNVLKEEDIKII